MGLNLTASQLREKAIQHAIAAAFFIAGGSTEILIAAIARMARTPGAGKPLSTDEASELAQQLYTTLTD